MIPSGGWIRVATGNLVNGVGWHRASTLRASTLSSPSGFQAMRVLSAGHDGLANASVVETGGAANIARFIVTAMTARGDWFGVRLVVEIQVGNDPPGRRTYEDRLIVVRASSAALARRKAERITRRDGESYRNFKGEKVVWRFRDVVDSYLILADKITDGTEVYSAFMNYRFYQSLASTGGPGLWQAYLKAHPRADPAKVTVGRILEWNARRAPPSTAKRRRLVPDGVDKPRSRKRSIDR
jgi:hypothetical protein